MVGVTILAGSNAPQSHGAVRSNRRYLAVDIASGRSLFTVVTDSSTAIDPSALYAGLQVRVYGVRTGRTIRARRIEIID